MRIYGDLPPYMTGLEFTVIIMLIFSLVLMATLCAVLIVARRRIDDLECTVLALHERLLNAQHEAERMHWKAMETGGMNERRNTEATDRNSLRAAHIPSSQGRL